MPRRKLEPDIPIAGKYPAKGFDVQQIRAHHSTFIIRCEREALDRLLSKAHITEFSIWELPDDWNDGQTARKSNE